MTLSLGNYAVKEIRNVKRERGMDNEKLQKFIVSHPATMSYKLVEGNWEITKRVYKIQCLVAFEQSSILRTPDIAGGARLGRGLRARNNGSFNRRVDAHPDIL